MFNLFRRQTPEERNQAAAIKDQVRAALRLGEDCTVSVSEIDCGDAACPGSETIILVMQPGRRTRAYKVKAPLAEVTDQAVLDALAEPEI